MCEKDVRERIAVKRIPLYSAARNSIPFYSASLGIASLLRYLLPLIFFRLTTNKLTGNGSDVSWFQPLLKLLTRGSMSGIHAATTDGTAGG